MFKKRASGYQTWPQLGLDTGQEESKLWALTLEIRIKFLTKKMLDVEQFSFDFEYTSSPEILDRKDALSASKLARSFSKKMKV